MFRQFDAAPAGSSDARNCGAVGGQSDRAPIAVAWRRIQGARWIEERIEEQIEERIEERIKQWIEERVEERNEEWIEEWIERRNEERIEERGVPKTGWDQKAEKI